MKEMNLFSPQQTAPRTASSTLYPHLGRDGSNPVLSLCDGAHITIGDDCLVVCSDNACRDFRIQSLKGLGAIKFFIGDLNNITVFKGAYQHVPGCLLMDYLLDVAGNVNAFWDFLSGAHASMLDLFFQTYGITVNTSSTLRAVRPASQGLVGGNAPETMFTVFVTSTSAGGVQATLSFAAGYVAVDYICDGKDVTWLVPFPNYRVMETTLGAILSESDYLEKMWSHLWRQLLASIGLRCDVAGAFYNVASNTTGVDGSIVSGAAVYNASNAHDVQKAIEEFASTMA